MLTKKRLMVFGVAAVLAVASCFAFSGCSGDNSGNEKAASSQGTVKDGSNKEKGEAPVNADADNQTENKTDGGQASGGSSASGSSGNSQQTPGTSQTAPEETKYGDAEVYTNDKGNPAAKTEDGVEVELTQENMEKLFKDYQEVEGSGSEEERALLDQIQVLLEVTQNQGASTK